MRNTGMILLAVLCTVAACGGDDDDSGIQNPLAPSGAAPMDTASGQSDAATAVQTVDLTALADGARAAKADTRTIDFSGVNWEWNAKQTHLEPDSFPDARVDSQSNVWKRGSGSGLIRIFSDTDLSGWSFNTAGGSWPLSQRRAGLYVSEITGAEVEQIRAGGASGGRDGGARTTLVCWPEVVASYSNPHLLRVPGIEATTTVNDVVVVCNQDLPKEGGGNPGVDRTYKVSTDNYPTIRDAAQPDRTPAWITPLDEGITGTLSAHSSSRRRVEVVAKLTLVPNPSRSDAREGTLDWDDTSPSNRSTRLDTITVVQERRGPPTADGALALSCKTVGCAGAVTALQRVDLKLAVTGLDSDDVECGIGESRSDCTWRIRREPVGNNGQSHPEGGRFLAEGTSASFTWEAPARPAGSSSIPYDAYAQIETNLGGTPDRSSVSTGISFTVTGDDAAGPRSIHVRLGCEQNRTRGGMQRSCLWDTNNPPSDDKITIFGNISTDPACTPSATNTCWGTPEWRYGQTGAARTELTPVGTFTDPTNGQSTLATHAKMEWRLGTLRVGTDDHVRLGTDSPIGGVNGNGGTGTTAVIQVRDTNKPPVIGARDDRGRLVDGITCHLHNPASQDQVDLDSCTVLRGYGEGIGTADELKLTLGVTDRDSNEPGVAWSGSGVFKEEDFTSRTGGHADLATVIWDSTGLSAGQYTLTATVTENRGAGKPSSSFRATRTVGVRVENYDAPPQAPQTPQEPDRTRTCDPNYRGNFFIEERYCGQRHDTGRTWTGFTSLTDYVWSRAVGSTGQSHVVLEETTARSGMRLRRNENRICGIARGVCGEYADTQVHSEGGNIYQWINITPLCYRRDGSGTTTNNPGSMEVCTVAPPQ